MGLWRYVENEDLITVAALGDLAGKLMQVSGGIKICDGN